MHPSLLNCLSNWNKNHHISYNPHQRWTIFYPKAQGWIDLREGAVPELIVLLVKIASHQCPPITVYRQERPKILDVMEIYIGPISCYNGDARMGKHDLWARNSYTSKT